MALGDYIEDTNKKLKLAKSIVALRSFCATTKNADIDPLLKTIRENAGQEENADLMELVGGEVKAAIPELTDAEDLEAIAALKSAQKIRNLFEEVLDDGSLDLGELPKE